MNEKKGKEGKDKGKNDGRWRCPTCKVEADVKDREIHIYLFGHVGHHLAWPLHSDCEFVNDIDNVNFSKLERVS